MNMRMQWCPSCREYREPVPMAAGPDTVLVCHNCDNAALFDHRRLWLEQRAEDVEKARECAESKKPAISDDYVGHHFEQYVDSDGRKRGNEGVCDFCPLHVDMEPEELFPKDALEDDEEMEDFL